MSINWSDVGDWIKGNAGSGAALIGSLLTGNIPGAVAAGVSMVSSATGHADPTQALAAFQSDPATVVKLKELAVQNDANINEHIRAMAELEFKDKQAEHSTTQATIMAGDRAEDSFVRRTRPAQSWLSLVGALAYIYMSNNPQLDILGILMALPFAYAGLRTSEKLAVAIKK